MLPGEPLETGTQKSPTTLDVDPVEDPLSRIALTHHVAAPLIHADGEAEWVLDADN